MTVTRPSRQSKTQVVGFDYSVYVATDDRRWTRVNAAVDAVVARYPAVRLFEKRYERFVDDDDSEILIRWRTFRRGVDQALAEYPGEALRGEPVWKREEEYLLLLALQHPWQLDEHCAVPARDVARDPEPFDERTSYPDDAYEFPGKFCVSRTSYGFELNIWWADPFHTHAFLMVAVAHELGRVFGEDVSWPETALWAHLIYSGPGADEELSRLLQEEDEARSRRAALRALHHPRFEGPRSPQKPTQYEGDDGYTKAAVALVGAAIERANGYRRYREVEPIHLLACALKIPEVVEEVHRQRGDLFRARERHDAELNARTDDDLEALDDDYEVPAASASASMAALLADVEGSDPSRIRDVDAILDAFPRHADDETLAIFAVAFPEWAAARGLEAEPADLELLLTVVTEARTWTQVLETTKGVLAAHPGTNLVQDEDMVLAEKDPSIVLPVDILVSTVEELEALRDGKPGHVGTTDHGGTIDVERRPFGFALSITTAEGFPNRRGFAVTSYVMEVIAKGLGRVLRGVAADVVAKAWELAKESGHAKVTALHALACALCVEGIERTSTDQGGDPAAALAACVAELERLGRGRGRARASASLEALLADAGAEVGATHAIDVDALVRALGRHAETKAAFAVAFPRGAPSDIA